MANDRRVPEPMSAVSADDDTGAEIKGTEQFALEKERPNTSKSRARESHRGHPDSPTKFGFTDSDSTVQPRQHRSSRTTRTRESERPKDKDRDKERRREKEREAESSRSKASSSRKSTVSFERPPAAQRHKTSPTMTSSRKRSPQDDPQYYGVSSSITPASSRPHAAPRSHTYTHYPPQRSSRPPIAPSAYYTPSQTPAPQLSAFPAPPPPPSSVGSYSQPNMEVSGALTYTSPYHRQIAHYDPPQASPPESQHLVKRFSYGNNGNNRPASAMGHRPPPTIEHDYDFADQFDTSIDPRMSRRFSLSRGRRETDEEDLRRMPPPPMRSSTVRPVSGFRPPPGPPPATVHMGMPPPMHATMPPPSPLEMRRGGFPDEDFYGETKYQEVVTSSYAPHYHHHISGTASAAMPIRPPSRGRRQSGSGHIYESGAYHIETANSGSRRNSTFYNGGSGTPSSGVDDKLRDAAAYQKEVTGGTLPLTVEHLRNATKTPGPNGGGSRSTRSSASREESEYKKSVTTRTTSTIDDDIKITVQGMATVRINDTEIHCNGGEISFGRGGINGAIKGVGAPPVGVGGPQNPKGGSDTTGSVFQTENRPSRGDRPSGRRRASSQAGSTSRTLRGGPPVYERPMAPPQQGPGYPPPFYGGSYL